MSKIISLHVPARDELWYRQRLLGDGETMSYNKGYCLDNDNYNNDTGCISFPENEWDEWYDYFIEQQRDRFYAYIVFNNGFIGEVNARKDKSTGICEMGIVIEHAYRGRGIAAPALRLLLDIAFDKLAAKSVHNSFEETRIAALKTHLSVGFIIERIENGIVDLSITKEQHRRFL